MQQGFGVVLSLCGKCSENKMFSSVQWNLYGCFVVFINIMGIAVNLLKHSARDGFNSLTSWSLLKAQAKTSPVVLFSLLSWSLFLVASSAGGGTVELRQVGHFWIGHCRKSPGELGRFLLPCSLLGTCGPWAGQEGQEGLYRWAGKSQVAFLDLLCEQDKSFFIFNLELVCSQFITFQLLEGRISCFVLFLYSVSLILLCPFVFWKWKKAEAAQVLCFICWAPAQTFSHSHSVAGCPLFQGSNRIEAIGHFSCCLQGFEWQECN